MTAAVVERFRLPPRRLPRDCRDAKAFIALADGPSTQEYDLAELQTCGATIIAYGRVARSVSPDYYLLADTGFAEVLDHLPPTKVLISRDGPYGSVEGAEWWSQLPQDRGHEYRWAPDTCAHHPVLNALERGAERVFLLGHDGYHRHDGRLLAASHAESLLDTSVISRERYGQIPLDRRQVDFWIADVNRLCWDMTIQATHRRAGITAQIYNLSFNSRLRAVWELHPDVLDQPFGRIDRRGPAMLIHILDTEDEVPGWHLPTHVPRARWGGLLPDNHAAFINRLRTIEPHLAIYVRTHSLPPALVDALADDIQIGGLEVELDRGLHSDVFQLRLPPIEGA